MAPRCTTRRLLLFGGAFSLFRELCPTKCSYLSALHLKRLLPEVQRSSQAESRASEFDFSEAQPRAPNKQKPKEVFASQLLNARSKHRSPARTRTRHRQSSLLNASDEDTSPTKLSFLNASRTRRHARHPRCQHLLIFTRQLHLLNSFRRTSPSPSRRG